MAPRSYPQERQFRGDGRPALIKPADRHNAARLLPDACVHFDATGVGIMLLRYRLGFELLRGDLVIAGAGLGLLVLVALTF